MSQDNLLPLPLGLPTFQSALVQLEHVPEVLYHALEFAASKTCEYKNAEFPISKFDVHLAAAMFRAKAIQYLKEHDIDAREDGCNWAFNDLPFAGISFYYNNQHVRILKGRNGELPGCGRSRIKKRFYAQVQTSYLIGNQPMRSAANFVVLWDFGPGYILSGLWLALPAKGGSRPQDVSRYWCEILPHPAEMQHQQTSPVPPSDDGLDQLIRAKPDQKEIAKGKANAR